MLDCTKHWESERNLLKKASQKSERLGITWKQSAALYVVSMHLPEPAKKHNDQNDDQRT